MRKCNACGRRFRLLVKNRYEVVRKPVGLNCLTEATVYYNAFDCPHCGCQNIVGVVEVSNNPKDNVDVVLDKIRAEIEGMYRIILKGTPKDDWAVRWNECIDDVLQIIDKYKECEEE